MTATNNPSGEGPGDIVIGLPSGGAGDTGTMEPLPQGEVVLAD